MGFLFLAIALPGLVVTIVKRIVGRARPLVAGEDAFLYKFFLWRVEYASFPSGHATTAFAAAVAFGVLWPRLRPLLWTYAIVIAFSRVVVTAHYPSDVVAGAIAGAVGALLVRDWLAARRLGFSVRRRRHGCSRSQARRGRGSKGLPAASPVNKKLTPSPGSGR